MEEWKKQRMPITKKKWMGREKRSVFVLGVISDKKIRADKTAKASAEDIMIMAEPLFDSLFDYSLFLSYRFPFSSHHLNEQESKE